MHNDGNVVPWRKVINHQAFHSPLARLPVIVLQVRDKAAQQLRQGLRALFDNADDTLCEMADRACDGLEQNIFFQAMRDLRLKRKNIERFFFEQFFDAFIRLTQYRPIHTMLPQMSHTEARTPLVDDEWARKVVVEEMVNKVLSRDVLMLVPELLKALREGLSGSAFDPFATSKFFTELQALHLQSYDPEQHLARPDPLLFEVRAEVDLPGADDWLLRLDHGK
jgi:hypothetical protein